MRPVAIIGFVFSIALFSTSQVSASEALAQENDVAGFPFPDYGHTVAGFASSDVFRPAQTFTPLRGGQLGTISVALARNGAILPDFVVVEFRAAPAGRPATEVLATSLIAGAGLEDVEPRHPLRPLMLSADFTSYGIHLSEGATYAFSLSIAGTGAAHGCGLIGNSSSDPRGYSGGWLWGSSDGGTNWTPHPEVDLSFQVTVVLDSDGDGVPDTLDQCPDTPAGWRVNAQGCSIAQLLPCEGPPTGGVWKNHGEFVSAAVRVASSFFAEGLITKAQRREIIQAAEQSNCGKKERPPAPELPRPNLPRLRR